jgi:hypothetical protein
MAETGKILRGCRAFWLSFGSDTTLLGKDSDELNIDNNPDVEQKENVLGENSTDINSYTPSMSHDYIARKEDAIYEHIQYINDNLAKDDEHVAATLIAATLTDEVSKSGTKTLTGKGFKVPVKVVVDTDGGATTGYTLPFTIYEDGARVQGTVSVSDKKVTFTASGAEASTLES